MILEPLQLQPCYKKTLWGGENLKKKYRKQDAPAVTGESWELAVHKDGASVIRNGCYAGKQLGQLGPSLRTLFWGTLCKEAEFPILVKLIDAAKDLSIQVHPGDDTANVALGEQGKAEMWYVMECEPQASIYFGFNRFMSSRELLRRVEEGTIIEVLNKVPVSKGDVYYILPGTIHAIGAGIVIAEIQQNSNTTFRIYDYQRRDDRGQLRGLNLQRAVEVVNYTPIVPEECRANCVVSNQAYIMSEMFSCKYFRAFRLDVKKMARLCCDGTSFHHLLCVEGAGMIVANNRGYAIDKGQSYFMPAALGNYEIDGECRVLLSRL